MKDKKVEPQKLIAESWNGRLAMLGLVAGFISYYFSGSLFFFGILGF